MLSLKNDSMATIKGVLLAYFVLALHMLLIAFVGVMVLFFRGIVSYLSWIFWGGAMITLIFSWYVYRKIKLKSKSVMKAICDSNFDGRPLEVNILGGLASFKLGPCLINYNNMSNIGNPLSRLDLYESSKTREIVRLAGLLEKKLITVDEYNEAKKDIL